MSSNLITALDKCILLLYFIPSHQKTESFIGALTWINIYSLHLKLIEVGSWCNRQKRPSSSSWQPIPLSLHSLWGKVVDWVWRKTQRRRVGTVPYRKVQALIAVRLKWFSSFFFFFFFFFFWFIFLIFFPDLSMSYCVCTGNYSRPSFKFYGKERVSCLVHFFFSLPKVEILQIKKKKAL